MALLASLAIDVDQDHHAADVLRKTALEMTKATHMCGPNTEHLCLEESTYDHAFHSPAPLIGSNLVTATRSTLRLLRLFRISTGQHSRAKKEIRGRKLGEGDLQHDRT